MNIKVSGMPDVNENMPVLTFLVRDSKDFTARELQSALIKFFIEHYSFLKAQELFTEWNNGRFRKILKRVKPNDFNKIVKQVSGRSYSSGNINLFVLPLHRKFDEPIGIKRAQVTGLTVLDEPIESSSDEGLSPDGSFVQFFVNSNIDMTVSKQTIALCHAVHQFFEETSHEIIEKWASNNYAFTINEIIIENNEKFDVVIHDAGLTEVLTGSITAAATCTEVTIMKENDSLGAVPVKNPRPSYFDETHRIKQDDFDEALKRIKKQRRLRENKLFFVL